MIKVWKIGKMGKNSVSEKLGNTCTVYGFGENYKKSKNQPHLQSRFTWIQEWKVTKLIIIEGDSRFLSLALLVKQCMQKLAPEFRSGNFIYILKLK